MSKWTDNELTRMLQLEVPILQAPMAEYTTPELAAAVSNAGGLGALGMWGFSAADARTRISGFRELSQGSLQVNYPLWDDSGDLSEAAIPMRQWIQELYDANNLGPVPDPTRQASSSVAEEHLEVLAELKPRAISLHFGLPGETVIDKLKQAGIVILCSATSVAEAKILEAKGVDIIIAQGTEAGGHRGTFSELDISMQSGLFALLPQVVDAVDVPVVAAGGIADGRAVAAAMLLGASGVLIGTAFLRCPEANISDTYRAVLADAEEGSTRITDLVSGRPARFVNNKMIDALVDSGTEPLPFPAQYEITKPLGDSGDLEFHGLLVGQAVALTREMPAADLVRTLVEETTGCLGSLSH